jgi:hypothetical protein
MSNVEYNAIMHQVPKIDEFGFNKEYKPKIGRDDRNALKAEVKIPSHWHEKPDQVIKTNTGLQEARRADKRPDITFDLDGDGHVGDRDYFLSKHFDKDKDGKLNATEKAEAIDAIKKVRNRHS